MVFNLSAFVYKYLKRTSTQCELIEINTKEKILEHKKMFYNIRLPKKFSHYSRRTSNIQKITKIY